MAMVARKERKFSKNRRAKSMAFSRKNENSLSNFTSNFPTLSIISHSRGRAITIFLLIQGHSSQRELEEERRKKKKKKNFFLFQEK